MSSTGMWLQGRLFDFGNKKPRDQPVNVDVAGGVPCGVAARRGESLSCQCLASLWFLLRSCNVNALKTKSLCYCLSSSGSYVL